MRDYSLESILRITKTRRPDFNNLLAVLRGKQPSRPTLFEFFLNVPLENRLTCQDEALSTEDEIIKRRIGAFTNAGYDYTTIYSSTYKFEHNEVHSKSSKSANEGFVIYDRPSLEAYNWEDPRNYYDGRLERVEKFLPHDMKFIVYGPGGVLENMISLIGFNNLCYMLADDPELVGIVAQEIGKRLYDYYEQIINYDCVGAIICNDDWGFNTQTMLSVDDMRKYVFPWHKRIVELAHNAGKPAILHSCGNLDRVWADIIEDIRFDAKHSYEDNIQPVEQAYDELKGKIAVLGGIDVDFVCRMPKDDIYNRCAAMLKKTSCEGYALGTGNSIPEYLPDENYFAMISAAILV